MKGGALRRRARRAHPPESSRAAQPFEKGSATILVAPFGILPKVFRSRSSETAGNMPTGPTCPSRTGVGWLCYAVCGYAARMESIIVAFAQILDNLPLETSETVRS